MDVLEASEGELLVVETWIGGFTMAADEHDDTENEVQEYEACKGEEDSLLLHRKH